MASFKGFNSKIGSRENKINFDESILTKEEIAEFVQFLHKK